MDTSNIAETATALPAASASYYCQKKSWSEEAGFMANIKESVGAFFDTPWEGHKACFKAKYHKLLAKFGDDGSVVPKVGDQNSAALLQASTKN